MTRFVGLDVSQKITAICVVVDAGRRLWRGLCPQIQNRRPHRDRDRSDDAMAGAERNLCTDPALLKPCILRSRRGVG